MENGNNNGFNNEDQQFGNQTTNGFEGNAFNGGQQQYSNPGQNSFEGNTFNGGQQYNNSTQNGFEGNAFNGGQQFNNGFSGQNAYGQNVYGQQFNMNQPPVGNNGEPLKNRFGMKLTFSILEILTIFSCNLLTGIMGIIACVFTTKANNSYKEGRWDEFKSQAKSSAILLWVGFAGFIIELIIVVAMMIFGFSVASIISDELNDYDYGYYDDYDYDYDDYDDESEETEVETETETAETEKAAEAATTPSNVVPGTGFTDPTVTINGSTVTFPVSYADFKAMGFHISAEDEAYVLNSMYYTSVTLYNANEERMGYCYLYDHTENAIPLSDCMVYGVCIEYDSYYDVVTDVVLPSGVTMNSTKEDWVTAYGTPDYEYESDTYDSQEYTWYAHNDAYYDDSQNSLEVSYWDGAIDEITIRYIGWE